MERRQFLGRAASRNLMSLSEVYEGFWEPGPREAGEGISFEVAIFVSYGPKAQRYVSPAHRAGNGIRRATRAEGPALIFSVYQAILGSDRWPYISLACRFPARWAGLT